MIDMFDESLVIVFATGQVFNRWQKPRERKQ